MQCLSKLNYLILSMIDMHVGVRYPDVEASCHLDVFLAETSQILLYPNKGFVSSLKNGTICLSNVMMFGHVISHS